jgi:hypothetical protein
MWWGLLWAFVIGGIAESDSNGGSGGAAFVAFLVIWYFVWKAGEMRRIALNFESRAQYLESEANINDLTSPQHTSSYEEKSTQEYIYNNNGYDD